MSSSAAPSSGNSEARIRRRAWFICLAIFLSYMLVYFHRLCPSVLALEMQESFQVSGTLLGLLGSAYFYPYGLMQLPVGLLADSWGPRRTVTSFLLVAAVGSLIMGLTDTLAWAVVGRVLVGVGVSTLFVCNFKLLAEWFPPRQMVVVGGVFMAMGGVGALSAATPLAIVSTLVGWRATLALVGGLTLVMAVVVYLVVRDRPPRPSYVLLDDATAPPPDKVPLWQGVGEVLRALRFWLLAVWTFLATGISFAIGAMWSVPYLQHVYGLSKTDASSIQSTFGISLIVGAPLLSVWANRFGRKAVLVSSSVVLSLVCAIFFLYTARLPLWALYVLFFLFFWFGAGPGPVTATYSKELFRPSMAGTSVGMVNFFPFLGGGVLQVIIGWLLASHATSPGSYPPEGYQAMFGLGLAASLISLAVVVFVPETLPPEERKKG